MPGMLWNAGTQCFAPSGGGGLINPAQPVNFAHPWPRGLVGFWKVVNNPGFGGGNQFYDLARGGGQSGPNDGTLQGTVGTNVKWAWGQGPPGSPGALLFDGVGGNVVLPVMAVPVVGSMAIWHCQNAVAAINDQIFGIRTNTPGILLFDFGAYGASGWYFGWYSSSDTRLVVTNSTLFTVGVWYRMFMTWSAAGTVLYFNGVKTASGGAPGTWVTSPTPYLGFNSYPDQSHYTPMSADGFSIWNRIFSDAEVAADYALERRGLPGVLNYLGTTEYSFPAKAAAGGLLMRRRRSIP